MKVKLNERLLAAAIAVAIVTAVSEIPLAADEEDSVLEFYPGVICPLGKFGDMAETGYGGMVTFSKSNQSFNGSILGVEAGFYYLPGKDMTLDEQVNYNNHLIFPLLVQFGYSYEIFTDLSVVLSASPGCAWVRAKYTDQYRLAENKKTSIFFDLFIKAGLSLEYRFHDFFSITAKGEYGTLLETNEPLQFVMVSIGAKYEF